MSEENKAILVEANAAISKGDNEVFLSLCNEDTKWTFVGDKTLEGKEAVRKWMTETYLEPPKFNVSNLISEGDFVTAVGEITVKEDGVPIRYGYCDVWRFSGGKMAELRAFVIKITERI